MRGYGRRSTAFSGELAVAALLVPPIRAVLACDGLQVADLPIELASQYRSGKLGGGRCNSSAASPIARAKIVKESPFCR
jgi:hypothetical protein